MATGPGSSAHQHGIAADAEPRAALARTALLPPLILAPQGSAELSAASTGSLANLAALPLPRFLIVLLPLQLPKDPVTKHEALQGAECRFDPAVVYNDLQGTALRRVPTHPSPLIIAPPIL